MRLLHVHQSGKLKCPYKGCEKEFDKPTVITDSSVIPRETHYTCPYCMSKLNIVTEDTRVIGLNVTEYPIVFDSPANCARARAQMEEPNVAEITLNKKSDLADSDYEMPFSVGLGDKRREKPKEQTGQSSEFQCSYHFGYLNKKDKNGDIPETCFGCPKSIECMLSRFNKSQESLEEIKKWYSFKF